MNGFNNLNNLNTLNYSSSRYNDVIYRTEASASLDLNFARNKSLIDSISGNNLVTFTRASSATFFDSNKTLQTANTDEPRFTHDLITGESLGFLIEEQRTNFITNNTMAGVATGTPGTLPTNWAYTGAGIGTLTTEIVNTGTVNGINYVDIKISGTTSTTSLNVRFENPANITTTVGQNWNCSAYLSMIAGSTSNITGLGLGLIERNSAGGFLIASATGIVSIINSTLTRYSHTRTTSNASTAQIEPNLQLAFSSGVSIDITIRIGLPQIENELFSTSVIITTGTATTRSADVSNITSTNFSNWYNSTEGTIYVNYIQRTTSFAKTILDINDSTQTESMRLRTFSTDPFFTVTDGTEQVNIDGGTVAVNTEYKFAATYKLDDFAFSQNGNTVVTDTTGTLPTVTQMVIGNNASNAYLNGTIKRISYFNTRLSNTTLENITK